jgi:hypothetical protein
LGAGLVPRRLGAPLGRALFARRRGLKSQFGLLRRAPSFARARTAFTGRRGRFAPRGTLNGRGRGFGDAARFFGVVRLDDSLADYSAAGGALNFAWRGR